MSPVASLNERLRIALLLVLAILPYTDTVRSNFVFDDEIYITGNRQVTHPSLHSLFSAPTNNVFRPVTFAAFALEGKVGNWRPFLFHVANVLLHALVTLLLYLVFRKLLERVPHATTIAFAASLLYAVHPIHAEVVAWAAAQSELLAAGFLLAAWLLHLHDRPVFASISFVLALLAKESALALLPLVFVGDHLRNKFKRALHYAGITVAAIGYVPLLWLVQGHRFGQVKVNFADNPLAYLPAPWRILNALRVAWKYLALQLYPATLSCDYSYNAILLYMKWRPVLPALIGAVLVLALWMWALRNRKSEWALAGAIYFAGFAATANLLVPTGTIMGERLAYFPSAGFCLLIAILWSRLELRRRQLAWALLVIAVVTLSGRTVVRNWDWRSNFALFSAGVRAVPGSTKVHADLGIAYFYINRLDPAQKELETALKIYPDLPQAVAYLGLVQAAQGHDEEALKSMQKAVDMIDRADFNYRVFSANLAAQLIKLHREEEALAILNPLITDWPTFSRGWSNRAVLYFSRGDLAVSRSDAETALRLEASNTQAQAVLRALQVSETTAPSH